MPQHVRDPWESDFTCAGEAAEGLVFPGRQIATERLWTFPDEERLLEMDRGRGSVGRRVMWGHWGAGWSGGFTIQGRLYGQVSCA